MVAHNIAKNAALSAAPLSALRDAKAILLDWDGCVMIGERITSAAQAFIQRHAERIVILSNNSTHVPNDFAQALARADAPVPVERIVLAGVEAVNWASQNAAGRVMLFGSTQIKRHARQIGLDLVRDEPDAILLTRDARFTYAKLHRAINALREGARLIVANSDTTHPGARQQLVPETGALMAALLACVPDAQVVTIGKPGPLLFEKACAIAGVLPHEAVMIGDNPLTDGQGALDFGITPILIGPHGDVSLDDLVAMDGPPAPRSSLTASIRIV